MATPTTCQSVIASLRSEIGANSDSEIARLLSGTHGSKIDSIEFARSPEGLVVLTDSSLQQTRIFVVEGIGEMGSPRPSALLNAFARELQTKELTSRYREQYKAIEETFRAAYGNSGLFTRSDPRRDYLQGEIRDLCIRWLSEPYLSSTSFLQASYDYWTGNPTAAVRLNRGKLSVESQFPTNPITSLEYVREHAQNKNAFVIGYDNGIELNFRIHTDSAYWNSGRQIGLKLSITCPSHIRS